MRIIKLIILFLFFPIIASAQSRILIGAVTGSNFGNLYFGPAISIEIPIHKIELDLKDIYIPFEKHAPYGNGWGNKGYIGSIYWLNKSIGLDGSVNYSSYHVNISKNLEYFHSGIIYRTSVYNDFPMRYTFNYFREFNNGIDSTGIESSHLQGGQFNLDMRIKCFGNGCYRLNFDFKVGHLLTQSNPVCDGTFGITGGPNNGPCYRNGAISGGVEVGLLFEFPRRKEIEDNPF